jgi:Leucine-rich repeat (LRR) protein
MSQHDKLDYNITTEVAKFRQRYALVAMDFAFHGNNGARLNWSNPNTDECTWDGVTCLPFSGVYHLRTINWARHNLTGPVLSEINLLPALETIDLAENKITGPLDPFYPLKFLKNLYLFENLFSGTVATEIGNLDLLERLYLGKNQLSGTFPEGLWNPGRDRPLRKFHILVYR